MIKRVSILLLINLLAQGQLPTQGSGGGGSGGVGTPGSPVGSSQYNVAGAFAGQSFNITNPLTAIQKTTEVGSTTFTVGSNLTLPAQTTPYTITLTANFPCNWKWSGGLINIVTPFTGGTGTITAQLQHGAGILVPAYDLTQSMGLFWDENPARVCVGSSTYDLTLTFTGNGVDNLNLFTAGAVEIRLEGHKDQ